MKETIFWCDILSAYKYAYGVAMISRLLQIIGFFFKISSLSQGSFAKETYHCKEPTNRSHCMYYGVASAGRIDKIAGLLTKEPYKRDNILQKRPIILQIPMTEATPYASPLSSACIHINSLICNTHIQIHSYVIHTYT